MAKLVLVNKPNTPIKCKIQLLYHLILLEVWLIKFFSFGKGYFPNCFDDSLIGTKSDAPNHMLPLFSRFLFWKLYIYSSTTAAQKANSSSNASCSANHSSAISSDIGYFFECNMTLVLLLNVLVVLQSLTLLTFQVIFGNLIVILSIHFTQLTIREGNLIYLGFKVTDGLHIQDCGWSFLCSLFVFLKESWTKLSKNMEPNDKTSRQLKLSIKEVWESWIKSEAHKTSVLTMQSFISVMNNEIKAINQMQEKIIGECKGMGWFQMCLIQYFQIHRDLENVCYCACAKHNDLTMCNPQHKSCICPCILPSKQL